MPKGVYERKPGAKRAKPTQCRKGHEYTEESVYLDPRGVRICKICRREIGKKYRENNVEAIKDRFKKWYDKNQKEQVKRVSDYAKANRVRLNATSKKRRNERKIQLLEEFGNSCFKCGYQDHPAALDFDHLDPTQKEFNVGMRLASTTMENARKEAAKCRVLCANCHRIWSHDPEFFESYQPLALQV